MDGRRARAYQLPVRMAVVTLGLVITWAFLLPMLLSFDALAFAAARQLGAAAAGTAGLLALILARARLRRGPRVTFSHRTALDLALTSTAAALVAWLMGQGDPRLPRVEGFSLLCLQVATGQAAALVQFTLLRGLIRRTAVRSDVTLPAVRWVFALSAGALGVFAAGVLGFGSAGRAAGVRDEMDAQRLEPLADLLATALALTPDRPGPKKRRLPSGTSPLAPRDRLLELLAADAHARAELRPFDQPPEVVLAVDPRQADANARDGRMLVLVGVQRHHFVRRRVGDDVLWLHAPAGILPPVKAPEDLPTLLMLGLLLLGVPLAALGLGQGVHLTLSEITRGLLAMGPGHQGSAPLGVPVPGDDELGDLAAALNRLCLRSGATSGRLSEDLAAAEQAEQARNRFLAAASHALRIPLERIADHFRALGRAGALTPPQQEDVDAIAGASRQLQSHIDEILALSGLDSGRENPLNPTWVNVGELAKWVVTAMRMSASPDVTLGISVDPTTPVVEADAPRIRQVLENLVGNALKFTQEGFVQVAVGPGQGGGVHVQVADSGPGIPAEDLTRIFADFHRVEAHRQVPGTGLGLAISQRLVQRHGGTLQAESILDEGSVFHLRLPGRLPADAWVRRAADGPVTGGVRPLSPMDSMELDGRPPSGGRA